MFTDTTFKGMDDNISRKILQVLSFKLQLILCGFVSFKKSGIKVKL